MSGTTRLKRNMDFARVYRRGRRVAGRYLIIQYLRRPGPTLRLGVTVSRKVRGSVRRNRLKRLLREAYRLSGLPIKPGHDLILVARATTAEPDYHQFAAELPALLHKAGLIEERCETPQDPHLKVEGARG